LSAVPRGLENGIMPARRGQEEGRVRRPDRAGKGNI
jgi:hypothetical protein